jgi:zinc transporter ZupT
MVEILSAAFLGLIAGLIPVYLGLIPLPFLKKLSPSHRGFLISFSLGILLFLFADVTGEAIEFAKKSPTASLLLILGISLGILGPLVASLRRKTRSVSTQNTNDNAIFSSYMISVGIGLHNLGEGLALGAAFGAGQVGLTTLLLVGFTLHNGTEGLAISGPITETRVGFKEIIIMGLLAGFPTIIGSIVGTLIFSELLGALFFSLASGAILYVVLEIAKRPSQPKTLYAGILLGIIVMYLTDLLLNV